MGKMDSKRTGICSLRRDEIKQIELNILRCVARFCESNGLEYCLACGTLLGAIRHKGFIPWDDDIDIIMPREDYNRFIKLFSEMDDPIYYKILDPLLTENYPYTFAKVVDSRTKTEEYMFKTYEGGVWIDIFPIDILGDDRSKIIKLNIKLSIYRRFLSFKMNRISFYYGRKKIGLLFAKIVTFFFTREFLISKINDLSMSLSGKGSKYCGYLGIFTSGMDEIFERKWFDTYIKVEFEGDRFNAPIGYKEILTSLYGAYMELPPKSERVTHHPFDAWYVGS